jgi:hypothetical protein
MFPGGRPPANGDLVMHPLLQRVQIIEDSETGVKIK